MSMFVLQWCVTAQINLISHYVTKFLSHSGKNKTRDIARI